jgi:hypothetical protein
MAVVGGQRDSEVQLRRRSSVNSRSATEEARQHQTSAKHRCRSAQAWLQ